MCCAATRSIIRFVSPESNFTSTSASPPIGVIFSITPLPNALCTTRSPFLKSGAFGADRTVFGFSGAARFAAPVRPVRAA